jgi:flavin-binding protein dodecin
MSIAKITEIIASSSESFEDALAQGIDKASQTIKGITGAWIESQKVTIKDGNIDQYRVNIKLTFVLK